jgi:hypothetical protein
VFTPAIVLRSSGSCSRSWFTASSSSGAARDAARSSPGTSSARRCGRVLPWAGAAAAPSPAPSHGALTDGVERENPNGVGCGGQLALSLPPLLLNPGAARAGRNPYAAPAWTARAPVAAPPFLSAQVRSQGRGVGVKRGFSSPGPGSIRARAQPVPRRAGRLAGATIPSRASPLARCGSVDPPPGVGKGGKGMRGR